MHNIDGRINELIVQLTRKTVSGEIKWHITSPPNNLIIGKEDIYPLYLQTDFKNATIGLFLKRYKYYTDHDEFSWAEVVGLCIVNQGVITWEFSENISSLVNLFEVARQQASGIDNILNNLLS